MKIYTRGGDRGKTGLHGGQRVDKDDVRIEANGTLDELNAAIGVIRAMAGNVVSYTAVVDGGDVACCHACRADFTESEYLAGKS